MERWQNRVAVITGASSGIGAACAKDLVTAGLQIVALGRRQERLDQNRSNLPEELQRNYYARKCDVSDEAEVNETFAWIKNTLGGTDILVNNAGIIRQGNLIEMSTSVMDEVLNTNLKGMIYCSKAAFKSMKERNFDGHIIHINSIVGHKIIHLMKNRSTNIYSATKFAMVAINEIFRNELRDLETKIKTTNISPGAVRTEMVPSKVFDAIGPSLNSEDVSQAVMFAISTPPHVQIHEIIIKPVGEKY